MPSIQWTDAVLNAQASGTFTQPDEVRAHTDDPGAAGTSNLIAGSSASLTWETAGAEGPLGASQPATAGKAYAAPSIDAGSDDAEWLSFWESSTFLGRIQLTVSATGTFQPSLALTA